MSCKHENARKVVSGAPAKWCPHCGGVWDGQKWHSHAEHRAGAKATRHVQRDAHKAARRVNVRAAKAPKKAGKKPRTAKQKAATLRMLAAAARARA